MLINGRMHQNGLIQSANTLADGVVLATAYGQDDSELFLQTNGAFSVEYTADGEKKTTEAEFDSSNMRFSATWKPDNGTATKIRGEFTTLSTNVNGTVGNKFSSLEFKRKNLITEIQVPNGNITTLDLSGCTQLATLNCSDNKISTLKLNTSSLKYFNCGYNALTAIDVSKNNALAIFNCGYNALTALDVSKNTALISLYCNGNSIAALDVSKNTALASLSCGYNALTAIDVSKNTALASLNCSYNKIAALDVSTNNALTYFNCSANALTALDVSKNTALTNLSCSINALTALDVSKKNTALISLYCSANALTALDVSTNNALTYFNCFANALTALDVSNNAALLMLYCQANKLTTLDVSNTKKVATFLFSGTLNNIGAANTSATIYSKLNDGFTTFADAGTLTTDGTEASAALRATAEAKGWTVTIVE